jgi:hypothetical protein
MLILPGTCRKTADGTHYLGFKSGQSLLGRNNLVYEPSNSNFKYYFLVQMDMMDTSTTNINFDITP